MLLRLCLHKYIHVLTVNALIVLTKRLAPKLMYYRTILCQYYNTYYDNYMYMHVATA